jgi:uncharacterized membrane protein
MYLLDPDRGKRRRALVRDKAKSLWKHSEKAASKISRDITNRVHGLASEARSALVKELIHDEILLPRVRSRIGRLVTHPSAIEATAIDGVVTLTGPVLAAEVNDLISEIAALDGVVRVENRLGVHERPDDVPGLQGGPARRSRRQRFELLQSNWSPGARFLVGTAGAALCAYSTRRRGAAGAATCLLGTAMLARSVFNKELKRLLGLQAGPGAVDIHKTFNVHAPIAQVFEFWSHYPNFSRFMSHLREVRDLGQGRSHWVAVGPAGIPVEWDAEITELTPNKALAWKSVAGSAVDNAGITRFEENPDGSTRLDIRISYNPPAGAVGHVIAKLFGADPEHALRDDMIRLKSLLEAGKTTAHGATVTREDLSRVS